MKVGDLAKFAPVVLVAKNIVQLHCDHFRTSNAVTIQFLVLYQQSLTCSTPIHYYIANYYITVLDLGVDTH